MEVQEDFLNPSLQTPNPGLHESCDAPPGTLDRVEHLGHMS